ncbi:unnamed protein product [Rotaria magnacalcarata]|uniref:TLC domain-containing protein n=1 Tax=Rotaria magnacalcarata TaxID=392030 RepID=A0A816LQM6_9BILA|nr:unnamed protein product [Rotaria magnacalcarata]CAF1954088.1 unnamed protein product [Rotaria magnacalcarata]
MLYDWNAFLRGTITGILTFTTIHHVLSKLISCKDERQRWKQVNVLTSFTHSIISSLICICCSLESPKMLTTEIISSFTSNAYSYVSFEIGYFIYDSMDILRKSTNKQAYEYLLHHCIVIGCFSISVYRGQFIGYCVLSLFIEINSIFLHFRQLLIFWNISRKEKIFRINSFLNFITFIIFRFGIITYMWIWLVNNRFNIPFVFYIIGQSGLLAMTIINMYLFYRLIKSGST